MVIVIYIDRYLGGFQPNLERLEQDQYFLTDQETVSFARNRPSHRRPGSRGKRFEPSPK